MADNDGTRIHPIWKEAAEIIAERVEREGRGFLIQWDELRGMLEINGFKEKMSPREFEAAQFEVMTKVVNLSRELLENHKIYIKNERNKGYEVLTPKDQITVGYDDQFKRARKRLNKAIQILLNVENELLTDAEKQILDRNLNKGIFVLSAMNKRRIPPMSKPNQIGEGSK